MTRSAKKVARDRRHRRDHLAYARHCMEVWAEWYVSTDERGWPSESSEVRAYHRAQTKTVTDGIAAYTGRVEVGEGGKTVAKLPPPMPKETRASAGSRVPNIDRARLGPEVHRCLLDMEAEGRRSWANALRLHFLSRGLEVREVAALAGVTSKQFSNAKHRGLLCLAGMMKREGS